MNATAANQTLDINATVTTLGNIQLVDSNTYISKDGNNNIAFTDSVTGTRALEELFVNYASVTGIDWSTWTPGRAVFATSSTNGPLGSTSVHGIFIPHSGNVDNQTYGTVVAGRLDTDPDPDEPSLFFKNLENGTWTAWQEIIHTGNINNYSGGVQVTSTSTDSEAGFLNSGSDEFMTIKSDNTLISDPILVIKEGNNAEKLRVDADGNIWTDNNTLKGLFHAASGSTWLIAGAGGNSSKTDFSTSTGNMGAGEGALASLNGGDNNCAYGFNSLDALEGGGNNSGYGRDSGQSLISGTQNCFFGYNTGSGLTTGNFNVLLGGGATTADSNDVGGVAIGYQGYVDGQGVTIGYQAGNNSGGGLSIKIGSQSGRNSSATNNVFVGGSSGYYLNGTGNTIMGHAAGYGANGALGTYNTLIGYQAGSVIEDGDDNVAIGRRAGYGIVDNSDNIFLGAYAGYYETGSSKLFISSLSDTDQTNEATARTVALIYGEMNSTTSSQLLRINAVLELTQVKTGSTQANAGAGANEVWATSGHATLPDNVLMLGV
jgi:hypothetical protein